LPDLLGQLSPAIQEIEQLDIDRVDFAAALGQQPLGFGLRHSSIPR
jgi:hypothetical protein